MANPITADEAWQQQVDRLTDEVKRLTQHLMAAQNDAQQQRTRADKAETARNQCAAIMLDAVREMMGGAPRRD